MAEHTCHACVYSYCDAILWLRHVRMGEPLLPRCANHPQWPGRMHDVPGVPCRNYRPRPVLPAGDGVRLIPLGDGYYAYVDAADYEWLSQWKWYMCSGYPARTTHGKTIFMHRQIMQPPKGKLVDHIDGNKANNCRSNLRPCNHQENQRNTRKESGSTSRFKGVSYNRWVHKWYAGIKYDGRIHRLGYFDEEVDAARAYDRAAVLHLDEFARLNFPEEWPPERRAQLYTQQAAAEKEGKKGRRKKRRGESSFASQSPRKDPKGRHKTNKLPRRSQKTRRHSKN